MRCRYRCWGRGHAWNKGFRESRILVHSQWEDVWGSCEGWGWWWSSWSGLCLWPWSINEASVEGKVVSPPGLPWKRNFPFSVLGFLCHHPGRWRWHPPWDGGLEVAGPSDSCWGSSWLCWTGPVFRLPGRLCKRLCPVLLPGSKPHPVFPGVLQRHVAGLPVLLDLPLLILLPCWCPIILAESDLIMYLPYLKLLPLHKQHIKAWPPPLYLASLLNITLSIFPLLPTPATTTWEESQEKAETYSASAQQAAPTLSPYATSVTCPSLYTQPAGNVESFVCLEIETVISPPCFSDDWNQFAVSFPLKVLLSIEYLSTLSIIFSQFVCTSIFCSKLWDLWIFVGNFWCPRVHGSFY